MAEKPIYEELKKNIQELEKAANEQVTSKKQLKLLSEYQCQMKLGNTKDIK